MTHEVNSRPLPPAAAPAPAAAAGPSAMDRVDRGLEGLWHLLSSMRVAIVIMLGIAILGVIGSLLMQMPAEAIADPARRSVWLDGVRPRYGGWTDVFNSLQLFEVFSSILFRILVAALTISLIACSIHRIPGVIARRAIRVSTWGRRSSSTLPSTRPSWPGGPPPRPWASWKACSGGGATASSRPTMAPSTSTRTASARRPCSGWRSPRAGARASARSSAGSWAWPPRARASPPGTVLLVAYAAGLAIPFLAMALGASWVSQRLTWVGRHHHAVSMVTGALLVILGVLMLTNTLGRLAALGTPFGL